MPKTCDLCLCSPFSFKWELGKCLACPTVQTLTDLRTPEDEEIYATWKKRHLVKKVSTPRAFLEHLQTCLKEWISHDYIRCTQGTAINKEKKSIQKASVFQHFYFVESYTVMQPEPEEIQSYHSSVKYKSPYSAVWPRPRNVCAVFAVVSRICAMTRPTHATPWLRCTNGLKSTSQGTLMLLMSETELEVIPRTNFKFTN